MSLKMIIGGRLVEKCLGSPSKIRLLTTLFAWRERSMTERQLARLSGLSTFGLRHALADLEGAILVTKKVIGRSHVWSLNEGSLAFQTLKPVLEHFIRSPSPLQFVKSNLLSSLSLKEVQKMIVFGSAVEGDFDEAGDIDIAIFLKKTPGSDARAALQEAFEKISGEVGPKIGKRLEPHLLTPREWERVQKRPLGRAILKGKEIYPHEEI